MPLPSVLGPWAGFSVLLQVLALVLVQYLGSSCPLGHFCCCSSSLVATWSFLIWSGRALFFFFFAAEELVADELLDFRDFLALPPELSRLAKRFSDSQMLFTMPCGSSCAILIISSGGTSTGS